MTSSPIRAPARPRTHAKAAARSRLAALSLFALAAGGCEPDRGEHALLGTLEWDRVELTAEASEPVREWLVREGDTVVADQPLLQLDARRTQADVAALTGELARLDAVLVEQKSGPRREVILEAEARASRATSMRVNAEQDLARAKAMRERGLMPKADLDRAEAQARAAQADVAAAQAAVSELRNGTRPEQIAQTEAARASASARLDGLRVTLERLTVRAPRAGRVDSLPMKPGDQPARGATVAVLLAGERPYARVYVPERVRKDTREGDRYLVRATGYPEAYPARLRHIESQPTFTPYYALTGDDASRLTYLAELELEGDEARRLPAGLPVQAERAGGASPPATAR